MSTSHELVIEHVRTLIIVLARDKHIPRSTTYHKTEHFVAKLVYTPTEILISLRLCTFCHVFLPFSMYAFVHELTNQQKNKSHNKININSNFAVSVLLSPHGNKEEEQEVYGQVSTLICYAMLLYVYMMLRYLTTST